MSGVNKVDGEQVQADRVTGIGDNDFCEFFDGLESDMFPSSFLKTIEEEEDEVMCSSGNNNVLMRNNNVVGGVKLPEPLEVIEEVEERRSDGLDFRNVDTNKFNYESYFDSLLSTKRISQLSNRSNPLSSKSNRSSLSSRKQDESGLFTNNQPINPELPDELTLEVITAKLNDLDLNGVLKYRRFDDLGPGNRADDRETQEDAEFEFIEELLRSLEADEGLSKLIDNNGDRDMSNGNNNGALRNVCESGIKMGDLSNGNGDLRNAIGAVSNETRDLSNETGGLRNETGDLSNKTHDLSNKTHDLSNKTHDFTNETHDLSEIHDLSSESGGLTNEIDDLTIETHDLTKETHDLTKETHDLTKETHDFTKETRDFTSETHDFSKETHDLAKETHDFINETHDLSEIDDFTKETCDFTKTHDLTKETHDLTKETHDFTNETHDLSEIDDFTKKTHDLTKETHDLTNETHDLTKEISDFTSETHDLSETHDFTKEAHDLTKETHDLNETHDFTKETHDLTKETHDLTNETHDFTNETHDLTKEISVFTSETHDLSETHDFTKETHDLTKETHDLTNETHDLTNETRHLTNKTRDIITKTRVEECISNGIVPTNIKPTNIEPTMTQSPSSDRSVSRRCVSVMVCGKVEEYPTVEAWSSTSKDGGCSDGVACATKTPTSIASTGVEYGAQPPGCSRDPAATVSTTSDTELGTVAQQTQQSITLKNDRSACVSNLSWGFRNGRLVFDVASDEDARNKDDKDSDILKSKDLNKKRSSEGRLRFLEEKLKEAGITDGKNGSATTNEEKPDSIGLQASSFEDLTSDSSEEDLIPSDPDNLTTSFCQFDPQEIHKFQNSFFEIYDELDDTEDDQESIMRGDGSNTIAERKQHNPNRDNLKSLLKKPGRNKEKKNRVIFNETKNEFFDADYIILIREECDYDEEEDDGVCTCNQHEMVRLTCCEPNCNCNVYEGFDPTPQSPKFAPPLEFVDAVTLSPPEEYKDMELEEQQLLALQQQMARRGQRAPVCRECSASHDDEGDGSPSDNEEGCEKAIEDQEEVEEKEKTDQSQQTTPTTPPPDTDTNDEGQRYILETLTMTTVSERQIIKEAEDSKSQTAQNNANPPPPGGSPISGILKGGRLWKQTSAEINNARTTEQQQTTDNNIVSDDEGNNKRSVRFTESNPNNKQRDVCDGAPEKTPEEQSPKINITEDETTTNKKTNNGGINTASPESTEMMLTFKLGNHVLISNNSLKPNSAVRQLFPCTKPIAGKPTEETAESHHQYLVTAESLKAFEEAKRSKLPQIIQSGETDDSIRRAIERNTLRRSLIRYEPKSRKTTQKTDNSLVERIKQLTCDVDEVDASSNPDDPNQQHRASPPGEEARNSPEVSKPNHVDKSFSPSSSSTASSNSSMSSTYKKITDLFAKKDRPDIMEQPKHVSSAPDLGNGPPEDRRFEPNCEPAQVLVKSVPTNEQHRKQFLSTLAPLTACVSAMGPIGDYYHVSNQNQGDRTSMASSVGTEYSLEDIEEVLRKDEEDTKKIAPDVLAGTPSASESGDELAMFVQQDAGRIERIKKKYQPETTEDDDEHDDYGFNRRPSVRGIKPRFGSTTEIIQQIQNQMQPPANNTPPRNHVAWPYYSETNLSTNVDNTKPRNINGPPPYPTYQTAEEIKRAAYVAHQYRPTSYIEENLYQNCTDQRCTQQANYRTNMNVYPSVVRVGGGCSDYYASLPRNRNGRPQSPPPQEVSKNYHQTMVYIPYNHIEGYHPAISSPNPYYSTADACYARVSNQNQINKRYVEATYQRIEDHYSKPVIRQGYTRSESPQISTARSTQTPVPNCTYYPPRYRAVVPNGVVWQDGAYVAKINRHSYPRYPPSDSLSLTDSDSQHSNNGYRETTFGVQKDSMPNSPSKTRFIERGVPEGAASVSPQDSVTQNSSTMTSPTSPQNPGPAQGAKPLFYAMNV